MQFHYFVNNTTDLRLKEAFGGERRPKDRVKTGCLYRWISVWAHVLPTFAFVS
jgi:hypothetical protein